MKQRENCPECGHQLHVGEHKFADGEFRIRYCKQCGYRSEKPE